MFFTFPENAHWNAEWQAVEFGVEIGEYRGVVRVARRVFQRLLPERPTPERCVEAYYLQRTRFESIVERKLRPPAVDRGWESGDQRAGLHWMRKADVHRPSPNRRSRPFPDLRPDA